MSPYIVRFQTVPSERRYLYRYRSLAGQAASFLERTICGNELYFASPSTFNDPFDCRPSFSMQASNAQLKKYYAGVLSRQATHMNRADRRAESRQIATNPMRKPTNPKNLTEFKATYHETITNRIGLLCLSEVPDDPLMWSHYADSHRGVCLAFNWQTEFFGQSQPVIYQKKRPIINPVFQTKEEMLDHALLTKSDHWKYEKEWRIIHYRSGAGAYSFPSLALTGVILGAQMADSNVAIVHRWLSLRTTATSIFRAALSDTEFKIRIDPTIPN